MDPQEMTLPLGHSLTLEWLGHHDVWISASQEEFAKCQGTRQVATVDQISFTYTPTEAGVVYFICGVAGHCDAGQKLAVDVADPELLPPPSPPPPSPPRPPSHPPPPGQPHNLPPRAPAPAATPSPAPVAAPTPTPGSVAYNLRFSTAFADLQISAFEDSAFDADFRSEFKAAVSKHAKVPADAVVILSISSGSVVVDSSVVFPSDLGRAEFERVVTAAPEQLFTTEEFASYGEVRGWVVDETATAVDSTADDDEDSDAEGLGKLGLLVIVGGAAAVALLGLLVGRRCICPGGSSHMAPPEPPATRARAPTNQEVQLSLGRERRKSGFHELGVEMGEMGESPAGRTRGLSSFLFNPMGGDPEGEGSSRSSSRSRTGSLRGSLGGLPVAFRMNPLIQKFMRSKSRGGGELGAEEWSTYGNDAFDVPDVQVLQEPAER